jgi:iron complex transport system substrate-binding protein
MNKMNCRLLFLILFLLLFPIFIAGCTPPKNYPADNTDRQTPPQRVIASAPSITEILFDIGAGGTVVGTSAFTKYPPEAAAIEKIGGLYDVSYEKILSLKPDIVFCLDEDKGLQAKMKTFGIPVKAVNHRSVEGVIESCKIIGQYFPQTVYEQAEVKRQQLADKLEQLRERSKTYKSVRLLLCVDRSRGVNRLENVFIAADNPFYGDIIRSAGGVNVASGSGLPFISPSAEGLIDFSPEVIIELYIGGMPPKHLTDDWKALGDAVPAVRNNRIYIITDDFPTIPGPRIPQIIELFAKILHGE